MGNVFTISASNPTLTSIDITVTAESLNAPPISPTFTLTVTDASGRQFQSTGSNWDGNVDPPVVNTVYTVPFSILLGIGGVSGTLQSNLRSGEPYTVDASDGSITGTGYFTGVTFSATCFLEGSKILCLVDGVEQNLPIETIRNGTLVKTLKDGYKPVVAIGHSKLYNPGTSARYANRLFRCSKEAYPTLTEDLVITGNHAILEVPITEAQKNTLIEEMGQLFVTDDKYRLIACVDERTLPYEVEGTFPIWHLALEHRDVKMNYGIWANGLLVESTSINFLRNRSGMQLV